MRLTPKWVFRCVFPGGVCRRRLGRGEKPAHTEGRLELFDDAFCAVVETS